MNSWICNMKRRQRIWNEQWTCQLVFAASPGARTLALGGRLKPPDWRWSKGEGWISWWEATPLTDWLSRAKILNPGFMSPSPDPGFMYQTQVLWVRFQNKLNLASYQSSMYCWEENIIVAVIVKKKGGASTFYLGILPLVRCQQFTFERRWSIEMSLGWSRSTWIIAWGETILVPQPTSSWYMSVGEPDLGKRQQIPVNVSLPYCPTVPRADRFLKKQSNG